MADKRLEKLFAKAQKAYQKKDRRAGAKLIEEILKKDFNHRGAWELLYSVYGAGQKFEDFQRSFTEKYYPDKLPLLHAAQGIGPTASVSAKAPSEPETVIFTESVPPVKKPSFFARLFGFASRQTDQPKAEKKPADVQPAIQPPAAAKPSTERPSQLRPAESQPKKEEARPRPGSSLLQTAVTQAEQKAKPSKPSISPARFNTKPLYQAAVNAAQALSRSQKIRVMVVDDIAQTRDTIIRSLHFHENIEVVGTANNGIKAIQLAKEVQPDVILMDVNMPDMDGITATARIHQEVPVSQVVILTVQDDVDYIRRAMNAGARDFLTKPPMIDDLVASVQRAYEYACQERAKAKPVSATHAPALSGSTARGRIISVYSPRGGAGCSMIAANLAVALHNEETPVIIVDGNLQFGDMPVLFNVQARNTILDLTSRSGELDAELIGEVVIQHSSGLRLIAPPRPEFADNVTAQQFTQLLHFLVGVYPYVIVDTSHHLADVTLSALDSSDLVITVTTQDILSIARMCKFLDLAPLLNLDRQRILIVMNQFDKRIAISLEKISESFKQPISVTLPRQSEVVVPSINRGIPFMLQKEMLSHPIARGILEIVQAVRQRLTQLEEKASAAEAKK